MARLVNSLSHIPTLVVGATIDSCAGNNGAHDAIAQDEYHVAKYLNGDVVVIAIIVDLYHNSASGLAVVIRRRFYMTCWCCCWYYCW